MQSLSLFPWWADRGDLLAGLFNAANIIVNVLDISFTRDLMCPLRSGRPGRNGVQTCDPVERLQDRSPP